MKRFVAVVQVAAALCAVAFVVLLFANEPDTPAAGTTPTTSAAGQAAASAPSGATVYNNRCASCHGSDGGGGLGPALSGGKVARAFPNIADQITVIADGRGGMPAFGSRLSEAEIKAVAEFERSL